MPNPQHPVISWKGCGWAFPVVVVLWSGMYASYRWLGWWAVPPFLVGSSGVLVVVALVIRMQRR